MDQLRSADFFAALWRDIPGKVSLMISVYDPREGDLEEVAMAGGPSTTLGTLRQKLYWACSTDTGSAPNHWRSRSKQRRPTCSRANLVLRRRKEARLQSRIWKGPGAVIVNCHGTRTR